MSIFDSLFDNNIFDFSDFFDLQTNNFNRPVKDMKPAYYKKIDGGWLIVANGLGIAKENLKVEVSNSKEMDSLGNVYPVLTISGDSKLPQIDFENTMNLKILLTFHGKINKVSYTTKDGLVFIKIETENSKIDTISASYTDDLGLLSQENEVSQAQAEPAKVTSKTASKRA